MWIVLLTKREKWIFEWGWNRSTSEWGSYHLLKVPFSKCLEYKEKKIMLSFSGELSPVWLFRYLPSSSPERKELRRCFEPKVFCFIPTPCWCTSTPCWGAGSYLPLTFSVLSRIVTMFFRLASQLKPVWVYTARRSSACSLVTYSIAGPSAFFICTTCWKNWNCS